MIDVQIMPDGETETKLGKFLVDDEAWAAIATAFEKRGGTHMVVDYEHQSVGGKYRREDGLSPAAGWIHGLRYEKGKGIIASVEWTDKAREAIQSKEYRYVSPAFSLDKRTRRVTELHSVAVTNTPGTPGITALAASDKLHFREVVMSKTLKRTKPRGVDLLGVKAWLALQDATPDQEAAAVESVVEEIDEVGAIIADIKLKLGLSDEIGPADVLRACLERLGAPKEPPSEPKELAVLKERLGLKADDTIQTIVTAVDRMQATTVKADDYNALSIKVAALEADKARTRAEKVVESIVAAGKLNPRDDKKMIWALKYATEKPDDFMLLMAEAPVVVPPDGQVVTSGGTTGVREGHIRKALTDYTTEAVKSTNKRFYVDAALSEIGEVALTDEEVKALVG